MVLVNGLPALRLYPGDETTQGIAMVMETEASEDDVDLEEETMESNETFPLHYLEMCWDLQERRVEEACRVDRRFQPTQQEGEFHRLIMVA